MENSSEMMTPVLFFDGVCNLCNGTVDFLIRMDKGDTVRLKFASLQSSQARLALEAKGLKPETFVNSQDAKNETVVFLSRSGQVCSNVSR